METISLATIRKVLADHYGFNNKVAVVTGGASGIGAAVVREFARCGATPIIVDRDREKGKRLAKEIRATGADCGFIETDLVDEAQCKRAVDTVLQRYMRLDILVNNAGVNDKVGIDRSPAVFRKSLERNLVHVFSMVHYAQAALRKAKGAIVNIGSKVSETGQGGTSGYAAAKGGTNGLTAEWAVDFMKDGVRVNAVIPAEVDTPLYRRILKTTKNPKAARAAIKALIPLGNRFTKPHEIADTVVFLASKLASHITGESHHVDGGYCKTDRAFTAKR